MAEEELELDVNESKKKSPIILIIIVLLLLNGAGIGAWLFLSGSDDKSSASGDDAEQVLGPLTYFSMVPEFIVNFGPDSKVRYLQVDLQISTRDEAALATVATYRPVIRNDILVLLSSVKFEDLKDRSGKDALQKKLLNAINKVVVSASDAKASDDNAKKKVKSKEHTSEDLKGPIENVYFTSFIMQ